MEPTKRLTRKQKRTQQQERGKEDTGLKINFRLKNIEPLTQNQSKTFEHYLKDKNLMLHGIAGTGKSFISCYLSMRQLMDEDSRYKRLVIVRSVVPTRDMGFLPGNNKEKTKVYEAPYQAIFTELFGRGS